MDALVLVVVTRRRSRSHGFRCARLGDELLGGFVEADQRPRRIVRPRVDVEHVLHRGDKCGVGFRRDDPVVGQVRFEIVFFSARPTVLKCAAGTILRSTTCSASRRMVQRAWPGWRLGAGQRRQLGLGLAIENRRNRRRFALFARQHRIEPLGHQLLAHARHHGQIGVERLDDLRIQPARAALGLIRLQQDARLEDHLRRRLALGDQGVQPCALLSVEFDNEFLSCHDRSALSVEPDKARISVRSGCP